MECFRCREKYDEELRRPKLLTCGHVFCQPCLTTADRCFKDDKALSKSVDDLPDDLFTLGLLRLQPNECEDEADSAGVSLWCQTCSAAACEACLDDPEAHLLHSMRRHRHEELLRHLENILAVLERPAADSSCQADDTMKQLACSGAADISLGDEDDLSAVVQLGGSGAEDNEVAWAVQQLLLRVTKCTNPEMVPILAATEADGGGEFSFGLFDEDDEAPCPLLDDEDDDEENRAALADLVSVDADRDVAELDLTLTADPQLGPDQLAKVRRVVNLPGKADPERTLQLLEAVAPHLEELQLVHADRAHLLATLRMPKLWRLEAFGSVACNDPFVVPADLPHDGGLRVLQAYLSPATVASLARAHHRTLEHALIMLPLVGQYAPGPRTGPFQELAYRGAGEVLLPHFKRCPYFPVREQGEFPALKSIEFEAASDNAAARTIPGLEALREMFPGVHVGAPQHITGWSATVRTKLAGKEKKKMGRQV